MFTKEEYLQRLKKWKYHNLPNCCANCLKLNMNDVEGKIMFNPNAMVGTATCGLMDCDKLDKEVKNV